MARRKSLAFLDVGQGDCFVADTVYGKKIKRKAKVKAHVASGTAATFARKEKAGASY